MTLLSFLAVSRMLGYAGLAVYALTEHRWLVWLVFTALTFSTYIYAFTGFSATAVEAIRTAVSVALIYTVIRRK